MKKQKGITMMVLVITVIVMAILAAVVLQIATKEDGMLKVAEDTTTKADQLQMKEEIQTVLLDWFKTDGTTKEYTTSSSAKITIGKDEDEDIKVTYKKNDEETIFYVDEATGMLTEE